MKPSSPHPSLCVSTLFAISGTSRAIADFLNAQVYLGYRAHVHSLHADILEAFDRAREILSIINSAELALDHLLWEFGHCLSAVADSEDPLDPVDLWADKLCEAFEDQAGPDVECFSKVIKGKVTPLLDSSSLMITDTLSISIRDLKLLLQPSAPPPLMPKYKFLAQDVLGLFSLSPLTSLFGSSAVSGLAKTYTNNDIKGLCQSPSARQNTSGLPSMHVNEFELNTSSPIIEPTISHLVEAFGLVPPFNPA
ncbi:hypothetical protein V8B97DRAFT_2002270 [Scleroderma yunnanense]